MKSLLLILMLFTAGIVSFAQNRTIRGKVTDEGGQPLVNASVTVKGIAGGTATNSNGEYSLQAGPDARTLVFSFIGKSTQEVSIGNKTTINAVLLNESKDEKEVVVVAYGSKKIRDNIGSISKVTAEKINSLPVANFDQALSGRAAGVQVSNSSGMLADGVTVRVRGANSISNNAQPLFVVDGVPLNDRVNLNIFDGNSGPRYNPLTDLNGADIESIEILKDAGAAVLYGSRAANGVILITTKKGKAGKTNISYNTYAGISRSTNLLKMLNGADYITINNEKALNRFGSSSPNAVIAVASDMNNDGVNDDTDWMGLIFGNNAFVHNHQLSVSGGNDRTSYYGSVDYLDQEGISYNNRLKRGSIRLNVDVTPHKWIKTGIGMSFSRTFNKGIQSNGLLAGNTLGALNAPSNVSAFTANGDYNLYSSGTFNGGLNIGNNKLTLSTGTLTFLNTYYHPIAVADLNRNDNISQRIVGNAFMEISPLEGLKFTSKFGVDYINNFEDQYNNSRLIGLGIRYGGLVQNNFLWRTLWNWSNFATYTKSFGRHNLSLMTGAESQFEKEQQVYSGGNNFADPFYNSLIDATYTSIDPVSGQTLALSGGRLFSRGFEGIFGRATYNYNSKYYAEASLRSDQSSAFGADAGKGTFPGVSLGWRISNENFMQQLSFINDLKLRGSYGLVGNAGVGFYASRTLYGGGQYADLNGFSSSQVGNSKLQWEVSKKLDIGLDASLFNNRVNLVFDYFYNNISDMVLNAPVVLSTGIPGGSITTNIGSMWNKGFEVTLNTMNVSTKDFRWSTSFNFTAVKNKVTALTSAGDIASGTQFASVGKTLGVYKMIRSAGVDPATGNAQFFNANGNIRIYNPVTNTYTDASGAAASAITGNDAVFLDKSGYPTWFGGLDNTIGYKNFELGVFLQYSGGNYIYNVTKQGLMTYFLNNNLEEIKARWQKPGDITAVPRLFWGNSTINQTSDRWLEKGDYLRVRLISLAYNVPKTVLQKLGSIEQVRFYVNMQNAFTITGYSGFDPEVNTNRNTTNIGYGIDNRSAPQARTVIVGLNVTL